MLNWKTWAFNKDQFKTNRIFYTNLEFLLARERERAVAMRTKLVLDQDSIHYLTACSPSALLASTLIKNPISSRHVASDLSSQESILNFATHHGSIPVLTAFLHCHSGRMVSWAVALLEEIIALVTTEQQC